MNNNIVIGHLNNGQRQVQSPSVLIGLGDQARAHRLPQLSTENMNLNSFKSPS